MYTKRHSARTYYGQANAAFPHDNQVDNATINALANFATSTASDRAALSKLTNTVQELTAELKAARTKIDDLQKQLVQAKQVRKKGGKENENPNAMLFYCWTYGFSSDHPSDRCPGKAEGHQDKASGRKTMGGSTANLDDFLRYLKRNARK